MSPDSIDLPEVDVSPDRAARIGRRGRHVLHRWADPFSRTWLGRAERAWIDRLEPSVSAGSAVALVIWSLGVVFAS